MLCELHAHTRWSDGALTLTELVDLYGTNGFDVLAVTDHVVRSAQDALSFGVHAGNHADYLAEIAAQAEQSEAGLRPALVPSGLRADLRRSQSVRLSSCGRPVGLRYFVLARRRAQSRRWPEPVTAGAALIAAHPYRHGDGDISPARPTQRFSRDWRELAPLVHRWELFNRRELFAWVAERELLAVASGDFHQREHLFGWKTLLPCAKREDAVVEYLRSLRPAFLTRIDDVPLLRAA